MLTAFAAYLAAHLLLYALWLRKVPAFRTERGIFLYHFGSAVLVAAAALACAARADGSWPAVVLILSAHGIYSLSFLELWSLAQGGYSLSILAAVARAEAAAALPDFSELERIGEGKQRERLAALARLRLVRNEEGSVVLTDRGHRVAAILHLLYAWVHPAR